MVEEASEAVGSMGDDTPVAVLSGQYRGLHHYFRQSFSQVTNPPIDSLRETRVMTLKTRLGNLGNVLDEHPEQCEMLMLDSPVLSNAEFDAMRAYMGETACVVDCTFPVAEGEGGLRRHIERIRREAEDGVRSGCAHVILTDEHQGPERAAIPMILAVSGVQTHLVRTGCAPSPASTSAARVHRRALLRGADRRGRHHGERLPGAGEHRGPAPARAVRRPAAEGLRRALQEGGGQGAAEGDVQDGHLRPVLLPRGHELRGDRLSRSLVASSSRACRRASRASGCRASRGGCWRCMRRPGMRMR
jgi:hypothetical protein